MLTSSVFPLGMLFPTESLQLDDDFRLALAQQAFCQWVEPPSGCTRPLAREGWADDFRMGVVSAGVGPKI